MSSLTAMGTSSTEFEPGPDFRRCLDTAGQIDLQLPAFLPIWKKIEARMWVEELLG